MNNKPISEQVADRLEQAKIAAENLAAGTARLYKLRCFETMSNPQTGLPIVTRVPGGWIFYHAHGGGSMRLHMGEGSDEDPTQQIVGQQNQNLASVFVPYSDEFLFGPDPMPDRTSTA